MDINYKFVPTYKSGEIKCKSDIVSYAGMLLELVQSRTVIVTLDNDDVPVVLQCDSRLTDALDFSCDTY